ncbi:MAG: rhomboid family intramembrane serine protease [Saprospiraceae bacterium]|nr:rhomboid family intramembrane serine protease [Saprospiraceae bacterium]
MIGKVMTLKQALKPALFFIGLMWAVHIIKIIGGFNWNIFGIYPRETAGLIGIFTAPLLHSNFQHLFSNSIPLFFMMTLIYLFYSRVARISFVIIYILTGFAVWLFGRQVFHIGASGVVYGLISFVFWSGVFRKNFKSVVLSLVIIILYSGYIEGVLPGEEGISWESHLLGAIVGILVAFLVRNVKDEHEVEERASYEDEKIEEKYFFDRDVFENKDL